MFHRSAAVSRCLAAVSRVSRVFRFALLICATDWLRLYLRPRCVATLVRVSAGRRRGAGRAGASLRPARAPRRAGGRPVLVARATPVRGAVRARAGCGRAARRGE
eukprot:1453913-Prymnesium_polylepis.1